MNNVIIKFPACAYNSSTDTYEEIVYPQDSHKVSAIKAVKAFLGCGLRTAKEIVEQALTVEDGLITIRIVCDDKVLLEISKWLLTERKNVRQFTVVKQDNFYHMDSTF